MVSISHDLAPPPPAPPEQADPFYYGQRMVLVRAADGHDHWEDIPLTLDDFLDPQEGDHFMQGTLHNDDTERLKSIFRWRYREHPTTAVYSDLKFLWGIPGLPGPCPDVAVVPHVRDKPRHRDSFDVQAEGTRPCLAVEMVSPRYRIKDVADKVAIYAQAGIAEYLIIDSGLTEARGHQTIAYRIQGYRLHAGVYQPIPPDERGWLYSTTTDVWIGTTSTRDDFVVVDAATGQRIFPAPDRVAQEAAARAAAEQRAAQAEQDNQALLTELARLRAQLTPPGAGPQPTGDE